MRKNTTPPQEKPRSPVGTMIWTGEHRLRLLDQRKLPGETVYLDCPDAPTTATAIRDMVVRGAPAIGTSAAYGLAAGVWRRAERDTPPDRGEFIREFESDCETLGASRPTAVNLFQAITEMKIAFSAGLTDQAGNGENTKEAWQRMAAVMEKAALDIHRADILTCTAMGERGADLWRKWRRKRGIKKGGCRVLTHCNTGALATGGGGTALGVVRELWSRGELETVWLDETRPYLQGARLTAWELAREKIPHKLVTDSMAAFLMREKKVDLVVVGADRIARNGDTANKIGTLSLAILARHFGIPFLVVAPTTTFDLKCKSGKHIPVEYRAGREITNLGPVVLAPEETEAFHPAFDVTDHRLITAIICERGAIKKPGRRRIREVMES